MRNHNCWAGLRACAAGLVVLAVACASRSSVQVQGAQSDSLAGAGSQGLKIQKDTDQASDLPAPRAIEQSWMSLKEWRARHERQLHASHRKRAELVVLGDSIVEAWVDSPPFQSAFGGSEPLNLGIGGDQTQHLLWRLESGIVSELNPRLAVVLVGVNNLGTGFSVAQTLNGIRAVVESLQNRLPQTPILLLRILPAGETSEDELRQKIIATNEELWGLAVEGQVFVEDIGEGLVGPEGRIETTVMADFLHPTLQTQTALTQELLVLAKKYQRPD